MPRAIRASEPPASRELLEAATVVCDDIELAAEKGSLAAAGLGPGAAACELSDILNGKHPGRLGEAELTVFGCVGLPFQDLVTAWAVYTNALSHNRGSNLNFLG